MSKEEKDETAEAKDNEETRHKRKLRSPCLDSHYEAYILRSRWTVGNLYASNLNLGHVHVKYVQDIDRQLKTWLHFTERDQQKLARRVLELEALKKQYFAQSMAHKEFPAKDSSPRHQITRHISLASAKQRNPSDGYLRRLDSHLQPRQLPDVFPPERARAPPKSPGSNLHPLKLLLPNQTRNKEGQRPRRRKTESRYLSQGGYVAPIHQEVLSGRLSSLSSRWNNRRTTLSANPRLSGVSHDKGGKKLVPRWVPLAFRL